MCNFVLVHIQEKKMLCCISIVQTNKSGTSLEDSVHPETLEFFIKCHQVSSNVIDVQKLQNYRKVRAGLDLWKSSSLISY